MPTAEQERLIERYAEGPDRLEAALDLVPAEAPTSGDQGRLKCSGPLVWSFTAPDSETNSAHAGAFLPRSARKYPRSSATTRIGGSIPLDYDAHP